MTARMRVADVVAVISAGQLDSGGFLEVSEGRDVFQA
jgi:hypothetical protein